MNNHLKVSGAKGGVALVAGDLSSEGTRLLLARRLRFLLVLA